MRTLFLLFAGLVLSFTVQAGQYRVSKVWPSGIHESLVSMQDTDKPVCIAFESALLALGNLSGPLACGRPLEQSSGLNRPHWSPLPKDQLFPMVKRLDTLIEKGYGREALFVESANYITETNKRIDNGDLTIETAKVPARSDGSDMLVVRYQRHRCNKNNSIEDWNQVAFFRADSEDLSKLEHIEGLGFPTDMFVFQNRAYFESESYRDMDDSFKHMIKPSQPLLFIYKMYDDKRFIPVCRLLYWKATLNTPSTTR